MWRSPRWLSVGLRVLGSAVSAGSRVRGIGLTILVVLALVVPVVPIDSYLKHPLGVVGIRLFAVMAAVLVLVYAVGKRVIEIEDDRQRLAERFAPKLQFVFGQGPPFEMRSETIEPVIRWQRFRIGVSNESSVTIDHPGVDLVAIHPKHLEELIQLPLPLLPMHGLQAPLDPGPPRIFDVVHRGYYPQVPHPSFQGNGDAIEICHAVEHLGSLRVPLQDLELTLEAHGANVPSRRQKVAVAVSGRHDPLSFSLLPIP